MPELKIGHGYDVHRLVEGRDLILGGIKIEHTKGLLGHSDADVLAHALMDALLGAMRAGDIGQLFPDTDPAYEGADSMVLLSHVMQLVRNEGFELLDCDCTVAAQAPKLLPHRDAMRNRMAEVMGVSPDKVGVKATTTEGLGFVGTQEGIAAWAVVLLGRSRNKLQLYDMVGCLHHFRVMRYEKYYVVLFDLLQKIKKDINTVLI